MTDMKSISAMSFKRACALNATSNESVLIHFVSGKFCSYESLMSDWNFILVKMTDMKSIPFWVSFHLNSCEHKQRPDWTPKWDFQPKWNLIPVWVHFASHVNVLWNKIEETTFANFDFFDFFGFIFKKPAPSLKKTTPQKKMLQLKKD